MPNHEPDIQERIKEAKVKKLQALRARIAMGLNLSEEDIIDIEYVPEPLPIYSNGETTVRTERGVYLILIKDGTGRMYTKVIKESEIKEPVLEPIAQIDDRGQVNFAGEKPEGVEKDLYIKRDEKGQFDEATPEEVEERDEVKQVAQASGLDSGNISAVMGIKGKPDLEEALKVDLPKGAKVYAVQHKDYSPTQLLYIYDNGVEEAVLTPGIRETLDKIMNRYNQKGMGREHELDNGDIAVAESSNPEREDTIITFRDDLLPEADEEAMCRHIDGRTHEVTLVTNGREAAIETTMEENLPEDLLMKGKRYTVDQPDKDVAEYERLRRIEAILRRIEEIEEEIARLTAELEEELEENNAGSAVDAQEESEKKAGKIRVLNEEKVELEAEYSRIKVDIEIEGPEAERVKVPWPEEDS